LFYSFQRRFIYYIILAFLSTLFQNFFVYFFETFLTCKNCFILLQTFQFVNTFLKYFLVFFDSFHCRVRTVLSYYRLLNLSTSFLLFFWCFLTHFVTLVRTVLSYYRFLDLSTSFSIFFWCFFTHFVACCKNVFNITTVCLFCQHLFSFYHLYCYWLNYRLLVKNFYSKKHHLQRLSSNQVWPAAYILSFISL